MATDPMLDPDYKYSINKFTGNGSKTSWDLNFSGGYIRREHVKAYTEAADGQITELSFTWSGPNTIVISPPVSMGVRLVVYRDTPKGGPLVDFTDGAIMNEFDLDLLARQAVFSTAEMVDRFADVEANFQGTSEAAVQALAAAADAVQAADDVERMIEDAPNLVVGKADRGGGNLINPAVWRQRLLLGNSSTREVGTVEGTVAAGNDARLERVDGKVDKADAARQSMYSLRSTGISRTVGDKLDQVVQLGDFKHPGNSFSDALDAAIVFANENNGGYIDIPPGNFTLTRPVLVPYGRIKIRGSGKGATVLRCDHTGDGIVFRSGSGSYMNSSVEHLSIDRVHPSTATGGWAVVLDGIGASGCSYIEASKFWGGVHFAGNNRACFMDNCGFSELEQVWIKIDGGGNQYLSNSDVFQNIVRPASVGLHIRETEGVWLTGIRVSRAGYGWLMDPVGRIQDVYMTSCSFDASYVNGGRFDTSNQGSVIRNVIVDQTSFSGSAEAGFVSDGTGGSCRSVRFHSCFSILNQGDGMFLNSGVGWSINQSLLQNNGNGGAQSDRVGLRVGGADSVSVTSSMFNNFDPDDPVWNPQRQANAVSLASTFVGKFVASNCDFSDQVSAAVRDISPGEVRISNCTGYTDTARGVASIPVGQSFVTVNPGVSFVIPSKAVLHITGCHSQPRNSGTETAWLGDFTSSTFDIVTSPQVPVTGSPLLVGWRVSLD